MMSIRNLVVGRQGHEVGYLQCRLRFIWPTSLGLRMSQGFTVWVHLNMISEIGIELTIRHSYSNFAVLYSPCSDPTHFE